MNHNKTSWTELNFIERQTISIMSPDYVKNKIIHWIVFECQNPDQKWILDVNSTTMDFGGVFHSIFLRWAVTINGLHIAAERYKSPDWINSNQHFAITGIRNALDGSGPSEKYLQVWDGEMASKIHTSSIPMLAAWAFCNMYACLEEFIFKIFRIFLESHPLNICQGSEFRDLRAIYHNRNSSENDLRVWNEKWAERLDYWHRKKLYDGLEKVFNNFIQQSNLKIPSFYKGDYNYSDVARTLGGISMIRNCFIHGATEVPQELGDFCKEFQSILFQYKTGDKFTISINELATLEYFTDTFTQTLNNSLFELANPNVKDLVKNTIN